MKLVWAVGFAPEQPFAMLRLRVQLREFYTVAGRAIGFTLEQPLHVVVLACSA
ncbi:MAG: hypothetical protein LBJ00_05765 [Planctomycetaceae bacterium]|nr:hypothetical protein [Planctomycetaceae bacterium]